MLLRHTFDDPDLNLALEVFLREIRDIFGERLVSVVLHGSIAFDDLAPGYGDLDFVAVVEDDLRGDDCAALVEARKPLRSGVHSVDWLLAMARLLLWVRERRLRSKSEAAEWAYRHAQGNWRKFLPQAKQMRLNPALADEPELKAWLETLTEPIQDACGEVESAVAE
jgi:predicted nucleotidyltransferase